MINHPDQLPPAVTVHGLAQALWALSAAEGRPILLLSAPGAAGYAGAGWFRALLAEAAKTFPEAPFEAALDCGDAAGHALAALRAGIQIIIFETAHPAQASLAMAAAEHGARLLPHRPQALDLAALDSKRRDDQARLRAWLATGTPQLPAT